MDMAKPTLEQRIADAVRQALSERGRKGAAARVARQSPEQRSAAGRKAIAVRWAKRKAQGSISSTL